MGIEPTSNKKNSKNHIKNTKRLAKMPLFLQTIIFWHLFDTKGKIPLCANIFFYYFTTRLSNCQFFASKKPKNLDTFLTLNILGQFYYYIHYIEPKKAVDFTLPLCYCLRLNSFALCQGGSLRSIVQIVPLGLFGHSYNLLYQWLCSHNPFYSL